MKIGTSKLDIMASALFLFFGVWVVKEAFDYGVASEIGPDSGTFPLVAGIFIAVFSAFNILRTIKRLRNDSIDDKDKSEGEDKAVHLLEIVRIAVIVLLISAYVGVFQSLGAFLPLPFLLVGISLTVHWRTDTKWLLSFAGISIVFTVVCYYVFAVFLGVLLPEGPFGW